MPQRARHAGLSAGAADKVPCQGELGVKKNCTSKLLPFVKIGATEVTRLIIGGNPFSGFSHASTARDDEMVSYYTASNIMKAWDTAVENGINTVQCRGDRHIRRLYREYRERGGSAQWIAQTASEMRDLAANIAQIAAVGPVAIYHHGTHTDSLWQYTTAGCQRA